MMAIARALLAAALGLAALAARGDEAPKPAAPAAAPPANLFPAQTWQPPPPPPPPPPKPTAPPLPFQYFGQLREEGGVTIFLTRQNRQVIVKAGDVIDNTYRVDAVTPQRVDFTYLPLKERQQLSTGTSQ